MNTFLLNQSNRNAFFPEKNIIMTSKYLYLSENLFVIDRVFGRLLSRDFQSENVGVICFFSVFFAVITSMNLEYPRS